MAQGACQLSRVAYTVVRVAGSLSRIGGRVHGVACRVWQSCVTLVAYRVPNIACRVLRVERFWMVTACCLPRFA